MIIGDKTYLRNFEISVQEDLSNRIRVKNQNKNNKKIKRKKGKNLDNNIYRDLKSKISVASKSERKIKEKLELLKSQEDKVYEMEATLKEVKSIYQQAVKDGNQKQIKEKIKIKKILKETNHLGNEYNVVKNTLNDDEDMIGSINEALTNIHYIKHKLSEYKSKLLNIEKYVMELKNNLNRKKRL